MYIVAGIITVDQLTSHIQHNIEFLRVLTTLPIVLVEQLTLVIGIILPEFPTRRSACA